MIGRGIIVTAPSGSGKTTIVRHLLKAFPELAFSVSATTRSRRKHETDGSDYHFLSDDDFEKRVEAGGFIEWEEVYPGKRYGSLKSEVERHYDDGKVMIFDVDVKGALRLKEYFGNKALSLFVRPPSFEALRERLWSRGTEGIEELTQRLGRAQDELTFQDRFDAVIVNDDLDKALAAADELVRRWLKATD